MLKRIRLVAASISFVLFVLLFCDLSGEGFLAGKLVFLTRIQVLPAILYGSFGIIIAIAAITFVYGRIYCSVVCPLGILQDILISLRKKPVFRHLSDRPLLRYAIALLFVIGLLCGIPLLFDSLEPYSIFGRLATNIGKPFAVLLNNGLDWLLPEGSSPLQPLHLFLPQTTAFLGALVMFLVLLLLCVFLGRAWCSYVCPVGTLLGCISRFALFRPRIDEKKCTHCGRCERVCSTFCIDAATSSVDASRCVDCYSCLSVCPSNAMSLGGAQGENPSRRKVLGSIVALTGALLPLPAQAKEESEASLLARTYRQKRVQGGPILPAGARSVRDFTSHCTGCQLCVAGCPHHVLQTGVLTHGLFQPSMSFEFGYCPPECTVCSHLCPTGALLPVSGEDKSSIQVGRARIDPQSCIVRTDRVACTLCQRNCPTGAITLVGEGEIRQPAVDPEKCIGCGACEFYCPARPVAAITVTGVVEHHTI